MIAYKYRSGRGVKDCEGNDVFKRDIDLLASDRIYIPTVAQLNDPSEAFINDEAFNFTLRLFKSLVDSDVMHRVEECFRNLIVKIHSSGVYSLSKEIRNELMWAYYASGHSGYAIIFDTDVLSKSFGCGKWGGMNELDVKYSATVPQFDISKVDSLEQTLLCLVGTKSKAWKHEAEHRLIFDTGGQCLKIDYRAIKGFVFGCRMEDADIDYVMKSFAGRDMEYYQVVHKDNSYELSLESLDDKYITADKYRPNKVQYDVEALLESDKLIEGVGFKYRKFVEEALLEVSREPFVTNIYQIIVTEDNEVPHILVWTKVKQDGLIRPIKSFEFDYKDETLQEVMTD